MCLVPAAKTNGLSQPQLCPAACGGHAQLPGTGTQLLPLLFAIRPQPETGWKTEQVGVKNAWLPDRRGNGGLWCLT